MRSRALAAGAAPSAPEDWRILSALGLYRLLLVTLLILLYQGGMANDLFELLRPAYFHRICLAYALLALVLMLLVVYRSPPLPVQAHLHFIADVIMVTLLVDATGGVDQGLGVLLLTPSIGCSLILSPRLAIMQAAIATLAMFGGEGWRQLHRVAFDARDFTPTGVLGLILFATNLTANAVAQRARRSEALAERVGSEYVSLSRLSESVIESMQTGVIVVDAQDRIRTINAAAQRLLGRNATPDHPLREQLPRLAQLLERWRAGAGDAPQPFSEIAHGLDLLPRFTRLGWGPEAPVLILVDNATLLREQAQQLKLAALGRLSASIAHEIRNPLSAITHAGQLLAESPDIRSENQRLLGMIQRHAGRIDKIVRDVLELTKRSSVHQERLHLRDWLVRTIALYQEGYPQARRPIDLLEVTGSIELRFDPGHLQQVLFNLWDNSFAQGDTVRVLLSADRLDNGRYHLDIADNGPGIPPEVADKIFEPFFTTHSAGTGLGLYLARELCEYNQGKLQQLPQPRGACFRILFPWEPPEPTAVPTAASPAP